MVTSYCNWCDIATLGITIVEHDILKKLDYGTDAKYWWALAKCCPWTGSLLANISPIICVYRGVWLCLSNHRLQIYQYTVCVLLTSDGCRDWINWTRSFIIQSRLYESFILIYQHLCVTPCCVTIIMFVYRCAVAGKLSKCIQVSSQKCHTVTSCINWQHPNTCQ